MVYHLCGDEALRIFYFLCENLSLGIFVAMAGSGRWTDASTAGGRQLRRHLLFI